MKRIVNRITQGMMKKSYYRAYAKFKVRNSSLKVAKVHQIPKVSARMFK